MLNPFRRTVEICLLLHLLLATTPLSALAADWPHWRGPDRNGVSPESSGWTGSEWPVGQPAWTKNVGVGSTSPVVVGDRVYALGWSANQDVIVCLDAATGETLWTSGYASPKYGRLAVGDQGLYGGPSSTPSYDAETGFLYSLGTDGDLVCCDARRNGEIVWRMNFYDSYTIPRRPDLNQGRKRGLRDYGYTTSPLIHRDQVIVEVGAPEEGNLMGFDKRTGRRLWTSENRELAGHSGGPVPMIVEGVPCAAILTLRSLLVVRLDGDRAGETAAEYPWVTDFANNIPTPAVQGNEIIVTTAYNRYTMCKLRITLQGAHKVWEIDSPSGVCSPVIHKNRVYWAWRGVHCVDFATGRELWSGGNTDTPGSCIVTADDRLIIWQNRGDLLLVDTAERSPRKYVELARLSRLAGSDAWPHVALAHGRIYCKDRDGRLLCLPIDKR